jgi:DNA-binding PadR family transcriptional regulator
VEGKVNVLDELIEDGRIKGVVLGEVRGQVKLIFQMLEEGDIFLEKAKSKIDALRPELDDENFWAEIDEKLKKL